MKCQLYRTKLLTSKAILKAKIQQLTTQNSNFKIRTNLLSNTKNNTPNEVIRSILAAYTSIASTSVDYIITPQNMSFILEMGLEHYPRLANVGPSQRR